MGNGCNFGDFNPPCHDGLSGNFNLFANGGSAPSGTYCFLLTTDGEFGESMAVTSMLAVPEPASWASKLAGLAFAVGAARRARKPAPTV